ncbi:MAG: sulfurtransferase TusE [Gammaproteobacteria bacterium]|nr:sulfurtransferase TusE [Gammaproteobacteria bacterium]|tara:strand:+ start:5410 stop:5754 length:345 start_codon:yes stop_codon:yes gene_type:complete
MGNAALVLPDGRRITLDQDGYLTRLNDWDGEVAEALASHDGISLTPEHWVVINLVRQFYQDFGLSPATRPLVKYVGRHLGEDKGKSLYLMTLFGGKPALTISRLGGLPRPANCF